jgi:hypothetical protein
MNNPPVKTDFALPSPNANPLTTIQLVQLLRTLVFSEIEGDYLPYVIGHSTPSVDDRNKVWIELDTAGRPISQKIWVASSGGAWRRIYNGMLGEVRMYSGDPTIDFDTDGRGFIGKTYDGWQLCNGKNGAIDLSDQFVIGGHMNKADGHEMYDNGWGTWVQDDMFEKTGGRKDHAMNADNTYSPQLSVGRWTADNNHRQNDGPLFGLVSGHQDFETYELLPGNNNPDHISNIPPFMALGFIQFVGYL